MTDPLAITFPPELVEAIAQRAAGIVVERLEAQTVARGWVDVDGAAKFLGCSPERVRKLAAADRLPYSQEMAGAKLYFSLAELDEYMRSLGS